MEDNDSSEIAAQTDDNPEENSLNGRDFGEHHQDVKDQNVDMVTDDAFSNVDNESTGSGQLDSSKYTPKISNRRFVSIQQTEGVQQPSSSTSTNALSAINEQTTALPFQNPLHNIEDDEEGDGNLPRYESHFAVDQGLDHDLRPVAPMRKKSDGSFQDASDKVRALEREIYFDDDENEKIEDDVDSVTSSYVGDVDERNLQQPDIQFLPDGYLRVEPTVPPQPGSFKTSSVHTEATSTMSASGGTTSTNVVPLSPGRTSLGGREINFSPGGSNIEGSVPPKNGSFRGNVADFMGDEDESPKKASTSDTKVAAAADAGLGDTTILDLEELLDAALNDDPVASDTSESATNPLSESNIPSESFLKMGAMMQSQLHEPEKLEEGTNDVNLDNVLENLLDEGFIVAGEKEGDDEKTSKGVKDEHDDLLETMLGDDDIGQGHDATEQDANDPDEELIDSMLGEKGNEPEIQDDYVPDESIRKLEALLDEGLATDEPLSVAEHTKKMEESDRLEIEASDSMARELDALLNGNLEEELNFDVESAPPERTKISKATVDTSKKSKGPIARIAEQRKPMIPSFNRPSKSSKSANTIQRKAVATRLFKKRESTKKSEGETPEKSPSKKKPIFGSAAGRRASGKNKMISTKTPKFSGKSSSATAKEQAVKTPRQGFMFSTPNRFMSPTIAFKRHIGIATEDRTSEHSDNNFTTPLQNTSKPSWKSSRKSFMSSTFSSLRKLRSSSPSTKEKKHRKERRSTGDTVNPDGTKSRVSGAYMEPTFAKIMLETETRIAVERKALEKEEEMKKIVVALSSWEEDRKTSPFLDYSYKSPKSPNVERSSKEERRQSASSSHQGIENEVPSTDQKRRILWTPNIDMAMKNKNDTAGKVSTSVEPSPHSVFSPRSYGSLSSQCSIRSFVSPDKAGIIGCQSKYNPYLHKIKGPCELCVFQLSDEEKDELDANGRHLMVQFTSGGCPDCLEFPTSFDEPPVRLCPRCYSISHRPKESRRRKKGNDAARTRYSFAKKEYA